MAEAVRETQTSRGISTSGGRGMGTRTFMCTGYESVLKLTEKFGSTVGGVALPRLGDPHPDFKGLTATDFSIEPVADSRVSSSSAVFALTWQYEVLSPDLSGGGGTRFAIGPNEIGYVDIQAEIRAEFIDVWRGDPNYPFGGSVVDASTDISGESIDVLGQPVSVQRNIQEVTITETVNNPLFNVYRSLRFNRNSATFLGAPRGKVLYKGCSVRRTGAKVFQVSHQFVEADDFHLRQYPLVDQEGVAIMKINGNQADSVYFIQPFPTLSNFNTLSGNINV